MVLFPPEVTLLLVAIAGAAVLAVLTTLANLVRNSTAVIDLHAEAAALRIDYAKQMARAEDGGVVEVGEMTEGAPGAPAQAA